MRDKSIINQAKKCEERNEAAAELRSVYWQFRLIGDIAFAMIYQGPRYRPLRRTVGLVAAVTE
jgi:hypothetical protein